MSTDKVIKSVRPSLLLVAPQTFWFTMGFGIFNVLVGLSAFNLAIFKTLTLIGIIPIQMWSVIFFLHGLIMLFSLIYNDYRLTKYLHLAGIVIKSAWWFEMLAFAVSGHSPFLLFVWTLLIFFQFIIFIYFTPRIERAQ